MKYFNPFFRLSWVILSIFLMGCNASKPSYGPQVRGWADQSLPDKPVEHTVYLAGDIGKYKNKDAGRVHKVLSRILPQADANSVFLSLGDNIYPAGLPAKASGTKREVAEKKLTASLDLLKGFAGKAYYIAGNHDWRAGLQGIRAQEKFIEQYPGVNAEFVPNNGCPGPKAVTLGKNLVMVTIDTEQWLRDMAFNTRCPTISREVMLKKTENILKAHEGKNIIMALHHPVFSDGPHGGHFSVADHLFPLKNVVNGLYLPLPGLGSLYPMIRGSGISVEDIPNEEYQALKEGLMDMAKLRRRVIFTSGHAHSLQYFKEAGNHFIVSGAASKRNYVKNNGKARFAHSAKGFVKLINYKDGSVWMEVVEPKDQGNAQEVVFRQKLLGPTPPDKFMDIPADSTVEVVPGPIYEAGWLKRFFFGDHYRDVWLAPIEVPVVDLGRKKGGLTLIEKGGGQQTMSLKLKGADGKLYTFRSIQKDPSKAIPEKLRNTAADDIVQDQISASIPYGAFAAQYMQESAGIYHTNPELVYIPDDPALGRFRPMFGGMLAMFEEDVDESWENTGKFGETENAVGTETMLDDLEDDSDNRIDQKAFLRVRLFDMLVGDWDRHGGQWRWAEFEKPEGDGLIFRPVPEDRDNVFFKFDGLIPWIASRKWALRKFQTFDKTIRDIKGLNYNGRHLDKRAFSELDKQDWLAVADTLQIRLTHSNMKRALKKSFPDTAYSLTGKVIFEKLKNREDNLKAIARRYYKTLAREVDVWGSHNSEFFEVERMNADSTRVTVYNSNDEGEKERKLYQRMFRTNETREIRLYALGDRDFIHVTGHVTDGIEVRIVGGKGKDVMVDRSTVNGWKHHTKYYDTKQRLGRELRARKYPRPANQVNPSTETKLLTKDDPEVHKIDRQSYQYDVVTPLVNIGFNQDDGFFLGGGATLETHAFRKKPYASRHRLEGAFAFKFEGYNFSYQGDFTELVGNLDLQVDLKAFAPNFQNNFYGFGNETRKNDRGESFFRVTYDQYIAQPSLSGALGDYGEFNVGPEYQYIDVGPNNGRFISDPEAAVDDETFKARQFGGLRLKFGFNTLTGNSVYPKNGFSWDAWGKSLLGLDQYSADFSRFGSEVSAYYTFDPLSTTLALRAGGATNTGDFEFFHANTLGGENKARGQGKLRGFRRDRFTGRSSVYQNTELRIKLFDFHTYLFPGQFGIMGLNDVGRVWADGENSSLWHHGYGGGFWLMPVKRVVFTGTYSISDQNELINVNAGFRF